jgi:Tol biopolymer transport system component
LLRLAGCYEKLGQQAQKVYEQVVRDFGDQPAAAQARSRLAALRRAAGPTMPATMTQRKLPEPGYSDGQRELSVDVTHALTIGDLAGNDKRLIFKPRADDQIMQVVPSRDFSMMAMGLITSNGTRKLAVIKADGTGYREIGDRSTCGDFGWSWDNRYLFLCSDDPDGTRYLVRVSAADGETRKMRAKIAFTLRPSPNGRFIAFDTVAAEEDQTNFRKVLVMPSGGGEPQVVSDNANLLDWTRDGRYLILESARSGSEALYLLPIQDGLAASDPVFVRYGPCYYGLTTSSGGLVCATAPPGGLTQVWLGALDSSGRVRNWERLNLGANRANTLGIQWSPDSTQINYTASQPLTPYVVRVRNISSGEEREVYRSSRYTVCVWAAQRPDLFCAPSDQQPAKELLSVSIDSGRVERLGALPATSDLWWPFFGSADDRAIYFGRDPGEELVRWDIGAQQATTVDRITGWHMPGYVVPVPNAHWIGRRNNDTTEIRPMSGGEWKPLISTSPTQIAFTPDGNWLLYHDVDAAGKDALFRVATAGGRAERIGPFPSSSRSAPGMSISPDGQKILARYNSAAEHWLLENFEPKQPAAR